MGNRFLAYKALLEYNDVDLDDLIDGSEGEYEEDYSPSELYNEEIPYDATNNDGMDYIDPPIKTKRIIIKKSSSMDPMNGQIDTMWMKFNNDNPIIAVHFKRMGQNDPLSISGNMASTALLATKMLNMFRKWNDFRDSNCCHYIPDEIEY